MCSSGTSSSHDGDDQDTPSSACSLGPPIYSGMASQEHPTINDRSSWQTVPSPNMMDTMSPSGPTSSHGGGGKESSSGFAVNLGGPLHSGMMRPDDQVPIIDRWGG